jgi:hypothetical protein
MFPRFSGNTPGMTKTERHTTMDRRKPAPRKRRSGRLASEGAHGWNIGRLADATKADPGTIGDFLNGERWPKLGTQGRIEEALGWPAGIIRQIATAETFRSPCSTHLSVGPDKMRITVKKTPCCTAGPKG